MVRQRGIVVFACFLAIMARYAPAAEVVDQQNDVTPSGTADSTSGGFLEIGQTFTVGVSGTLSRIGAQINWPGFGSPGNAILTLYNTAAGKPNASLGTASIPTSVIPSTGFAFQSFDLSSYAIPVHVGDVLAYGISSSVDTTVFARSTFNQSTYAGGETQSRQVNPTGSWSSFAFSHDIGFQTYVVVSAVGLPGDFNNNGAVDAADYVVWRDHLGDATEDALNGNGDGTNGVDQNDYALWRGHFGGSAGGGSALRSVGVPEPAAAVLIALGVTCIGFRRTPKQSVASR